MTQKLDLKGLVYNTFFFFLSEILLSGKLNFGLFLLKGNSKALDFEQNKVSKDWVAVRSYLFLTAYVSGAIGGFRFIAIRKCRLAVSALSVGFGLVAAGRSCAPRYMNINSSDLSNKGKSTATSFYGLPDNTLGILQLPADGVFSYISSSYNYICWQEV